MRWRRALHSLVAISYRWAKGGPVAELAVSRFGRRTVAPGRDMYRFGWRDRRSTIRCERLFRVLLAMRDSTEIRLVAELNVSLRSRVDRWGLGSSGFNGFGIDRGRSRRDWSRGRSCPEIRSWRGVGQFNEFTKFVVLKASTESIHVIYPLSR